MRDTLHGFRSNDNNNNDKYITQMWVYPQLVCRVPPSMTINKTTEDRSAPVVPPGVPLFQSRLLWGGAGLFSTQAVRRESLR